MDKDSIELEILEYNYWEHFKLAKDIALILSINNPRRKELERTLNELSEKINKLKHGT